MFSSSTLTALYSPVRAVPLRPRLLSPNGHRAASPRQASTLQPIAGAPTSQASQVSRPLGPASPSSLPLGGLKSCPLTQTMLSSSQSQHSPLSIANALSTTTHFERSPSAARQLQIIALSSGRQPQSSTYTHTSVPAAVELPERSSQSKRTLSGEDALPLPLNPSLPKATSPLPSPPSLLGSASPPSRTVPQTQTLTLKAGAKESEEQKERGRVVRQGIRDEGSIGKELRAEKDDQRGKVKEEKPTEKEICPKEKEVGRGREEEQMEVIEEGQLDRETREMEEEEEGEMSVKQSESPVSHILHQHQNTDLIQAANTIKDSSGELKSIPSFISAPLPLRLVPYPVPEASIHSQKPLEPHRDLTPVSQEDFCENMSTQSDNQSGTLDYTTHCLEPHIYYLCLLFLNIFIVVSYFPVWHWSEM